MRRRLGSAADRIESVLAPACSVTSVTDGDTAIQRLLHGDYDCILLDLICSRT